MIELRLLSGTKAGAKWSARRFPVRIGRGEKADFQVVEPGVWEEHLRVDFVPRQGIELRVQGDAIATVNGQPFRATHLRNGDVIGLGSVRLQVWLGETQQRDGRWREWMLWGLIAAISLAQVVLVYCLGG